jgi:hypothetical protein
MIKNKPFIRLFSVALLTIASVAYAGKIQNEDVKTFAELKSANGSITGNLTSGSACITSPSSIAGLSAGLYAYDTTNPTFIPAGARIIAIPGTCSAGQIQLSAVAAGTATGDTITFGGQLSQLINDSKIYVTANGINQDLSSAITSGLIGGGGGSGGVNYLSNPGFEIGTTAPNWTITTATGATETTTIYAGTRAHKLTYSGTTGGISQSVTPTPNTISVNMEASCKVLTTMTTIQVCGVSGGTDQNCTDVPATGSWQYVATSFVGPSNGTSVGVNVKAKSASTGTLFVDDCYAGPTRLTGNTKLDTSWVQNNDFTFLGMGTPSNVLIYTKRVGDTLMVQGTYTSGTVTSTAWKIVLPSYFTIAGNKLPNPANGHQVGWIQDTFTSAAQIPNVSYGPWAVFYDGSDNTGVFVAGHLQSGGFIKEPGTQSFNSTWKTFSFSVPITQFADVSVYKADSTPASWSGSFTTTGGCSTSSSTYADTSACTSASVTQTASRNFGEVTTAPGSIAGITANLPAGGMYEVCANLTVNSTGTSMTAGWRLVDGSGATINPGVAYFTTSGANNVIPLCGQYSAASASAVTFKVQGATSSGSVRIDNASAQVSGAVGIMWTIKHLDTPMGAPFMMGQYSSQGSSALRFEYIDVDNVCTSTPCTINRASSSWVTSVTRNGTGDYTLNLAAGSFASQPVCFTAVRGINSFHAIYSPSTSVVNLEVRNNGLTLTDARFSITCMGAR